MSFRFLSPYYAFHFHQDVGDLFCNIWFLDKFFIFLQELCSCGQYHHSISTFLSTCQRALRVLLSVFSRDYSECARVYIAQPGMNREVVAERRVITQDSGLACSCTLVMVTSGWQKATFNNTLTLQFWDETLWVNILLVFHHNIFDCVCYSLWLVVTSITRCITGIYFLRISHVRFSLIPNYFQYKLSQETLL